MHMIPHTDSACTCRQYAKIVYSNIIAKRYAVGTIKRRPIGYLKIFTKG